MAGGLQSSAQGALHLVGERNQPALIESLIIVEYLDEKYPENPLLAKDPLQRALDKILVERFSGVTGNYMKILVQNAEPDELWASFDVFEEELGKRGTPYFSGSKPGFVDYMIWPWFERLPVLKSVLEDRYNFDDKRFAKLNAWIELMLKDELVKSFFVTPEQHVEFWRTRKVGNANYDMLA